MTRPDRIQDEIRAGEEWLAGISPPVPPLDMDLIKMRVRIALGEQWLAEHADADAPANLDDQIRQRLAVEAARLDAFREGSVEAGFGKRSRIPSPQPPPWKGGGVGRSPARLVRWTAGVVGLAAALVFGFRALFPAAEAPVFSAYEAFVAYDDEDWFSTEFAMLDEDLMEIESSDEWSADDEDGEIDELRDEIDRLLSTSLSATDWL